ncbi:16S rRNA (cytosine(967)-C(5))-methyltransferase RsmB [Murimonas intestini]|uniref:16S rRNA (cytosine(967)-C(5))-methyltransferase n=1 Tax=Murimonas intestini TaxID=1337051 RepID=A0AB73SZV6_9FIRM|nr:16S rRNA (cytosine(967)-C(5))-methyltransferase RsmB [Murimonas intestini]MCR1843177.1 16S rRNA (cytosine(967)-C(5))-methyltransferase RsmB [Murimonas intestini]MCR1868594.1 16S rRNA (cytosine(967)-C(5))-methyltransferase RsmB [Murimonas intestini]MCR1885163.1 16S rRNA (cytosine(967)-C(5))-methyltransferase RsmB [Murimonas intestini]
MTKTVNIRELVLEMLMQVTEEGGYSHIVLREVLEKYQYLEKRDRSFLTRVFEGTLENMIQIDYIIGCFSKVKVEDMKPLIRDLLRLSVYQLKYMDSIPDSAVCNEAVKIAQRRGFYNLKGFVNGVLRSVARGIAQVEYPDEKKEPEKFLSVTYSMPEWILEKWLLQFDYAVVKRICEAFHEEQPTTIRCNLNMATLEEVSESLKGEGIEVKKVPYLDYALQIRNYNYLKAITSFKKGWFQVQDVSSMLVAEIAAPQWGDYCIDVCAAPGGKSLHLADKLKGSGYVEARDVTDYKVALMQENIDRINSVNMEAVLADATVFDPKSVEKADILIADVPCSGLGVLGKKADIKYKMSAAKQQEIIKLQRKILDTVYQYVKVGGTLIYSTCTIGADENQYNVKWFLDHYPFRLDSIDPYISDELKSKSTKAGYLQLLPGVHKADGFFISRFKRIS